MQKLCLILFLLFSGSYLNAQTNLDSLYTIWEDVSEPDSTRRRAYGAYLIDGFLFKKPDTALILADDLLAFGQEKQDFLAQGVAYSVKGISNYLTGNNPEALAYLKRCLEANEKAGSQDGIAEALNNLGAVYIQQSNYPQALIYGKRALKVSEEMGDKSEIANALNNIGGIYSIQGNNPKAIEYHTRSLKLRDELRDKVLIATSLNNIGAIYGRQGNHPKALDYHTRSLKLREEVKDKRGIASSLNNIGFNYEAQGKYSEALDYVIRSLKLQEEVGNKGGMAWSLNNIGLIYSKQGNYTKALDYVIRSLNIREEIGDKVGSAASLMNIGIFYKNLGNYNKAIAECKKSLRISKEIETITEQKNACACLYDSYKAMGKGNEALKYLELMNIAEDSLKVEETSKKLQQMEFAKQVLQDSIETAEKERLVAAAHQQEMKEEAKTRNIGFGIGGLVLLAAILLYTRLRFVRRSKATLQIEKDRSESLLLNILPEEIAEELKEKGRADARDFDMVSILFTDFISFTETSATLSAQDLLAELNTCFEVFDDTMEKYGIEKIKTIGDAYMAAGGLPIPGDDSAKNTVLAALEMQAFIIKRKGEMDAMGLPGFEMRTGIHTGPVVAGIVGVKKFAYDIWGDTVNTASRMESSGAVGQVNISQTTYDILKDEPGFTFESRGEIEAKGKGKMDMYFVSLSTEK